MTGDEKTNYLRIGLGLSGVVVNDFTAEIIWRTVEGLQKKKGEFSVSDQVEIEMLVKGKLEKKKISLEENSKKSERISERKKHQAKKFGHSSHKEKESKDKFTTNYGKYEYSTSGSTPSIRFKNKYNKECVLTLRRERDGQEVILLVGGRFVVISTKQKNKFTKLIEKNSFNSEGVYYLADTISNNFTAYIDSNGRTVKVARRINQINLKNK